MVDSKQLFNWLYFLLCISLGLHLYNGLFLLPLTKSINKEEIVLVMR